MCISWATFRKAWLISFRTLVHGYAERKNRKVYKAISLHLKIFKVNLKSELLCYSLKFLHLTWCFKDISWKQWVMKSFRSLKTVCCLVSHRTNLQKAPPRKWKWDKEVARTGKNIVPSPGKGFDAGKDSTDTAANRQRGPSLSAAALFVWCQHVILPLAAQGCWDLLSLKLCIILHCHLVTDSKASIRKYATVMQKNEAI